VVNAKYNPKMYVMHIAGYLFLSLRFRQAQEVFGGRDIEILSGPSIS
jgi:hypothetical protein